MIEGDCVYGEVMMCVMVVNLELLSLIDGLCYEFVWVLDGLWCFGFGFFVQSFNVFVEQFIGQFGGSQDDFFFMLIEFFFGEKVFFEVWQVLSEEFLL